MGVLRGERLKAIRTKRGLSQEALAELLSEKDSSFPQQQISSWENGRNDPSAALLVRLSEALNVSVDYLLGVVDEPDETYASTVGRQALMDRLQWALDKGKVAVAAEVFAALLKGNDEPNISSS